jgi:hypothetical protein
MRLIEIEFNINFFLIRYATILYCTFLLLKTISISESFKTTYKGISAFLVVSLLIFLSYSVFLGLPALSDQTKDYLKLKQFLSEKAFLFSIPLLLFIKPNINYWKSFIKYSYLLLFFLIPLFIFDVGLYITREKSPEGIIKATAGVSGFFLLISPYFKDKKKIFIIGIFMLCFFLMLYHARRNIVLYFSLFFIFYYYFNFFSKTALLSANRIKLILRSIVFGVLGIFLFLIINPDFSLFFDRVGTGMESRELIVEEFLFDVVPFTSDFYFGRGMFGTFYSQYLATDELKISNLGAGQRDLIENGYLQLILNFGFVYLLIFSFLSLLSFYKGFFKSKNLFIKSCATVILINLIDMIGYGLPEVSFRYFLVWLSLPFCFSDYYCKLNDLEIKKLIFSES